MDDKLEKKLKEFLPYIIILGVTFLVLPFVLRLLGNRVLYNNIVLMGVFPVVTFGCNAFYAYKKTNDMLLSFVAPVLFIPAMFLYGIFANNAINSLIYLVSYFICGYIGLTVGDMIKGKDSSKKDDTEGYSRKKRNVPEKVNRHAHAQTIEDDFADIEMPQKFEETESVVDTPATQEVDDEYDLDAILAEIHSRHE